MDAVGIAAAVHQASGELVDDDDLAVFDDVLLIFVEEVPRLERGVELVGELEVALIVEVGDAQHLLDLGDTLLGDRRGVRFLIDREVLVLDQARDDLGELAVELGRVVALAADDERRARLVDEDRVDFVDDREVEVALHHLIERPRHVVAQIVEPDLVVGDVGDVGVIGRFARVVVEVVLDDPVGQPQRCVERAHPFGVALGEVVVDGDEVDAFAGQRVEVDRQGRDERLALTGAHFGDVAFVQRLAAHDLHVEVPQAANASGRSASSVSPASRRALNSAVLPRRSSSESDATAGSSALTRSTVLRNRTSSRSLPSNRVLRKAIRDYNHSARGWVPPERDDGASGSFAGWFSSAAEARWSRLPTVTNEYPACR